MGSGPLFRLGLFQGVSGQSHAGRPLAHRVEVIDFTEGVEAVPHLHIIGICGTAMAGLAALAQEAGWRVSGSDAGIYPPMSTFLEERGIHLREGYSSANLEGPPDLVLVGNAISRGNAELEALLDSGLSFRSGAEWLMANVLEGRHPVVVAGTHGKTTTSSIVAWVLDQVGMKPGFFIGGLPKNFGVGVRHPGASPWVVVEGDEYDTAFFDKRPKFLHYRPRTLILHNLEFDHADIYPDLESIRQQFRLLVRTVPRGGVVFLNGDDKVLNSLVPEVRSRLVSYGLEGDYAYTGRMEREDGREWTLLQDGEPLFTVHWNLTGRHNVYNGVVAAAVALVHGADGQRVRDGLSTFQGVARRMDRRFAVDGVAVYDDFAHHPTAIRTTLAGLKASGECRRVWAVVEPRSNTMRRRVHQESLPAALAEADGVILARPGQRGLAPEEVLDVDAVVASLNRLKSGSAVVVDDAGGAVDHLQRHLTSGDGVLVMSNGGFDAIFERLETMLRSRTA
ncbi:MAG: UDP-N-acetylmuramate:L-alanyl-gamma-D-glutamyl-meso-diaminopimelate ligase [Magnetococcales bacterium]|nr:UDP-N-acetylmuramate:L-alanyl-gamma-D-glutamyl-meso-diaminopimelate ligase [Magnetococcales bacterium]